MRDSDIGHLEARSGKTQQLQLILACYNQQPAHVVNLLTEQYCARLKNATTATCLLERAQPLRILKVPIASCGNF